MATAGLKHTADCVQRLTARLETDRDDEAAAAEGHDEPPPKRQRQQTVLEGMMADVRTLEASSLAMRTEELDMKVKRSGGQVTSVTVDGGDCPTVAELDARVATALRKLEATVFQKKGEEIIAEFSTYVHAITDYSANMDSFMQAPRQFLRKQEVTERLLTVSDDELLDKLLARIQTPDGAAAVNTFLSQ